MNTMSLQLLKDTRAAVASLGVTKLTAEQQLELLDHAIRALESESHPQPAKPVLVGEVTEHHTNLAEVTVDRAGQGWGMLAGHYRDTVKAVARLVAEREALAYERGKAESASDCRTCQIAPGYCSAHQPAIDLDSEATIANAPTLRDSAERERVREMQAAIARAGALLEANGCDCECGHHPDDHDEECTRCLACLIEDTLRVQLRDAERLVRP